MSATSKLTAARGADPWVEYSHAVTGLPMRDFAHSLPMALLKAREAVMAGFRPDLEAHGLTEQQWRVLRVLTEHPGISAGELADRAALLKPSLSRIVGRLEERGLVERRPGERDLRLARLTMTVTGHRLVRTIAPRSEARYGAIEAAFEASAWPNSTACWRS